MLGFYLKQLHIDTSIVESSPAIRSELHCMRLAFRASEGNRVADRVRLPFTLDLIAKCVTLTLNADLVIDRFTAVALKMGVGCLFRKCKYIKSPGTDHRLRTMDVDFVMERSPGAVTFVTDHHTRDLPVNHFRKVVVVVRSAKNNFEGVGNKIAFSGRPLNHHRHAGPVGIWRMPGRLTARASASAAPAAPSHHHHHRHAGPVGVWRMPGEAHGPRVRLGGAGCALAPSPSSACWPCGGLAHAWGCSRPARPPRRRWTRPLTLAPSLSSACWPYGGLEHADVIGAHVHRLL